MASADSGNMAAACVGFKVQGGSKRVKSSAFSLLGDASEASESPDMSESVVAFGVFDGLHVGHACLIAQAVEDAHRRGASSVALTFDVDPDELLHPVRLKKLTDNDDRLAALAASGFDRVEAIRFNENLASLSPESFLNQVFLTGVPAAIYVGENMRFGHGASGDVALLEEWGRSHGVEVHAVPLLEADGQRVSSTRIRLLLQEGRIEEANRLFGHQYQVCGQVVHGANAGAQLGFRTANLMLPDNRMVLADGVYAAYADVCGKRFKSAVNVGLPPTFEGERTANVEAHILDFAEDIYGKRISLSFVKRLRPLVKFNSVDELKRTVAKNFQEVRDLL